MSNGSSTRAAAFKNAFFEGTRALFATTPPTGEVLVVFGRPSNLPPDIIALGSLRVTQAIATVGAPRSREEVLQLDLLISVQRAGMDPEIEQLCSDIAYSHLATIERWARFTDTTIGGTVRECAMTSHTSAGSTSPEVLRHGRCIDLVATFEAKARISG